MKDETEKPPIVASANVPALTIGGTGTIRGTVTDPTGAVIANAQVTLDAYVTRTDATGQYSFSGIKPATYRLLIQSPGFQPRVIDRIPVQADHVTRADAVLTVGATSEVVTVEAEAVQLSTMSAEVSEQGSPSISTPRVREYFPETLYWQPELITDRAGNASVSLKLADTITTWHVAVIGSTEDGRISETSMDVRAFQPFMVDLDVPVTLTTGDLIALPATIRNHLDHANKIAVSTSLPPQLSLEESIQQPGRVEPASSANAILALRAGAAVSAAKLRVTASGKEASDAIEKPVSIHPDGERQEVSVNEVVTESRVLRVTVPATAIPGSVHAELKIYPSLLARILESMESMLTHPHGCGEQTISSTYPNLLFLQALRESGVKQGLFEARARKNLAAGYRRLLGYQDDSGGFTYWGHGEPDVSLTAYAITFLDEAKSFLEIDGARLERAVDWLKRQDTRALQPSHALQIAALIRDKPEDEMLGALAREAARYDDPYAIAAFANAALDAGKPAVALPAIERLKGAAQDEEGTAWWGLHANTPFHGWGRWGQVETTAMAVSALAKWRKAHGADAAGDALMRRGAMFLLRNSDSSGAWATSQATVRALMALLDLWSGAKDQKASTMRVLINGAQVADVAIPAATEVRGPVSIDASHYVRAGATNQISLVGAAVDAIEVQANAVWYEKWAPKPQSDLRFEVRFNRTEAAVNGEIDCDVAVSRAAFRGYGMLIAEIGLPPGSEVDRGTLASVVDDTHTGVDSFEVAPDHVTLYIWPRAADSKFRFVFRPRFAMKARATPSVVYDYYNPDERVALTPQLFTIQ